MTSDPTIPTFAEKTSSLTLPNFTLRDWFAGKVLTGLWASPDFCLSPDRAAKLVYDMADAMMAERGGSVQ